MLKTLALLLLLANTSSTVRVDVTVTPSVRVPSGRRPGTAAGDLLAAPGIGVLQLPAGHTLVACKPNLEPEQSAWKELLENANGRLCTVTRVPA